MSAIRSLRNCFYFPPIKINNRQIRYFIECEANSLWICKVAHRFFRFLPSRQKEQNISLSLCLTDYGHPERAFFLENSKLFGLGQKNWAKHFLGLWGYFWLIYQHPFWYCGFLVQFFHFYKKLSQFYIQIPEIYLWVEI